MTHDHDDWEPDWDPPPRARSLTPQPAPGPSALSSPSARKKATTDRVRAARRARLPGPAGLGLASIPTFFAFVALLGIGLRQDLPPWEAGLGAGLLVGLPMIGIAALTRFGRFGVLAAMWLWSLAVLTGLPRWMPGERADGLSEGLAFVAMPLGENLSARAGRLGQALGDALGPDSSGVVATEVVQPEARDPEDPLNQPRTERNGRIVLPYEGDGGALRVTVTFDGPAFSEELDVLFDTGATFTTLDRGALTALGVPIPPDAPLATFQTANGKVTSPMVLLDRVWLGETAVEGVTVAVCDDCSQEGTVGLLGLNVTQQFRTSMDHDTQEVILEDAPGPADRGLDLAHWVALEGRATKWPTGRVVVELAAANRSVRDIHEAVVEVECPDRSFAVTLNGIAAGATAETSFELPRGSSCDSYSLVLRSGRW